MLAASTLVMFRQEDTADDLISASLNSSYSQVQKVNQAPLTMNILAVPEFFFEFMADPS